MVHPLCSKDPLGDAVAWLYERRYPSDPMLDYPWGLEDAVRAVAETYRTLGPGPEYQRLAWNALHGERACTSSALTGFTASAELRELTARVDALVHLVTSDDDEW
ncbi:hypothetical protein [Bailinhaonella thermotolerans]|uniref:Uncharacterized protein n=1 Tax=Bailinhaonella thermotolerans TaxID=1070861 RepID=A0A3A4A7S2_9ACTN|nr:hypothetical protein [Bailinhaonella thermotolerans]RJL21056.1 hypothetical protein D5H75_38225 [Bailinhaonella thermotolerans]